MLVFYGSSWCQEAFNGFGVSDAAFPTRAHLFVGTYDMDRIHDVWWRGEPRFEERRFCPGRRARDLAVRDAHQLARLGLFLLRLGQLRLRLFARLGLDRQIAARHRELSLQHIHQASCVVTRLVRLVRVRFQLLDLHSL